MLNLASLLEDSAGRWPTRDALVCDDTRLTYAEVDAATNRIANLLVEAGIRPGDRIALSCINIPQFPIIYYGILKAGAVVVPMNVLLKAREIAYHLTDSSAKAYFCFEGGPGLPLGEEGKAGFDKAPECTHFFPVATALDSFLDTVLAGTSATFESVPVSATDTAVILYTSGTTGTPKGAELTHANMMLNALTCHRIFGTVADEVHLIALPLFHSFGQSIQLNSGFGAGATLVLLPRFTPAAALAAMERERVTFFAGVPTMYWGLVGADTDTVDVKAIAGKLRMAVSGGAALPVEIHEQVLRVYGVEIREGYGLSETSPIATFNHPGRPVKPGSIGEPVWGVRVKLVDKDWREVPDGEAGEIAVRGHNVMKGYLDRPEATEQVIRDGWFRTGDIATRDSDGYYFVVDRAKDMIVRGGFNVYPRELEEVILTHPAVSLVAVVGVPHPSHGEEVKAFVIKKPGAELTEDELVAWCRENMAGYKYPRIVEFRGEFPMTSTGKILKRELR
ncbi:MAG TPA: long-chain fatty acid--CoA ligase [Pseudonocardiaceae bacterium]|jgi:long-chain acyl-CoA synthetase|nr:long-chain fatty acid--CoA ligase [Pseudonocardiaceae bacterium]